jgi:RNA polymerase sigma-70 factor (ECF subfamily)
MERNFDEQPLLQRVAAGSAAAVEEFLERYSGLVWKLARTFLRDSSQAEDALQEIFIDLWRSAGRFDPERGSEAAFVATIARRRLIDRLRKIERQPAAQRLEDDASVGVDKGLERLETCEEAGVAARAIRELKPEQQQVIVLSVVHGLSHRDIATRTGMPLGTVKSNLRRGLARAVELLGGTQAQAAGGVRS